jgi:phosphoribosylformimino-5-aminoimidazole carboxamide ribonucleotide (ProFAR) isomerase
MRSQVVIAADIVESQATECLVSTDLYMEGTNAGLNVDTLIEQAEEIYAVSEETFQETFDTY